MSWVVDDWTAGLPGTALQKVRELQAQHDRLQREKQQRQLQLESAEAALCKQKQKFEEVRVELVGVRRDLQSSQEEVLVGVRERTRLSQELQVKQAQVCSLEGQLDSARSVSQALTQEVKRLEAELEKLQDASSSGDSVVFSTPCWNMSSREHSGSRRELKDSSGSDSEVKALHVRNTPPSSRRNRQPKPPPASGVFPWEREEASPAPRGRPAVLTTPSRDVIDRRSPEDAETEADVRRENDIQRSKILELQTWVESLKQEVHSASDRHRVSEARLVEVRGELAAREQTLSRAREELDRANIRAEKEKDRAQAAEQRVKQLQEELSCQRQNAESSRRSAEQRRKDLEREHQRELLELQKESQSREKQHQQESNKLNQELQQARTLYNTLQAQCDKVLLQKQALEKDLDSMKSKLLWTEKELQECQKREAQIQSKLTEALRERDSLGLSLEQSGQRVKSLEEEVKRLTQELAEALKSLSELQAQLAVPATPAVAARCIPVGDSFSCPVTSYRPSHVPKKKVARPEKQREEQQELRAKYPTDREPGEGIDSDFIGELGFQGPEKPKGEGGRARNEAERRGSITQEEDDEKGGKEASLLKRDQNCILEEAASIEEQEDAVTDQGETMYRDVSILTKDEQQGHNSSDGDTHCVGVGVKSQHSISSSGAKTHQSSPSLQDLKRENAALRDDLREAKRELEQRLEDLETQRRAETEARTKLKQLSRKHSSQVEQLRQKTQELKEQGGRLEKQVEEERKESDRLREALNALEEDRQEEQTEKKSEVEDRRAEMDKLRADLAALESELRKEQEDREREKEEEEMERLKNEECRRALTEKVEELKTELADLQNSKWQGDKSSEEVEKQVLPAILDLNSNNNNAVTIQDDHLIPSPTKHVPFSNSVEAETIEKEIDLISKEGEKATRPGESGEAYLGKPAVGESERQVKPERFLDSDEVVQLVLEVERLRGTCARLQGERDKESGRAKQAQARLEVLQSQVTNQTKQLTLAFENQSSNIKDLLGELQDRDSALQRLEEELRGCHGEIAELKAKNQELKPGSEGFEKPDEAVPVEMTFQTPSALGQGATPGIDAEQMADKPTLLGSAQTPLLIIPPPEQVQQSINNDGSVKDLLSELRDLKAENEELRSKVLAAATVKGLDCADMDPSALLGDGTTQRIVVEFEAAKEDLRQMRAKNEELQSMLSQAELSNKQEKQPLDSEVKQGPFSDSSQNIIVSGDLGSHAEEAVGTVEAFVNEDLLTEQRESKELKLMEETTSFPEGTIQLAMSPIQKAGDTRSQSNKDLESDIDLQHHRDTIVRLQAVNHALRSWALAVCPPDRQRELADIAESGLHRTRNCEQGEADNKLPRGENLSDEGSTAVERVAVSEQSGESSITSQFIELNSLTLPSAQELASPHSSDGLNLDRGKDLQEQMQSELCGLKSGEADDTTQLSNLTDKTKMELDWLSQITALQKQVAELQSQVSSLRGENMRQAEELEVWRVTGEPISPLLMEETASQPHQGSIVVVREDRLLLTCKGDDLGTTRTIRDVQVEFMGRDIIEKISAPAEKSYRQDGQGSLNPAESTQQSLRSTQKLAVTTQMPTTDTNVLTDSKTKAVVHRDMDIGTKTRLSSRDVSHPRTVPVESDGDSKLIQYWVAGKETKATQNTNGDNQQEAANYSESKAAGCRITEDDTEAVFLEDSQAKTECTTKTKDHKGTHAILEDDASAVSEHVEPVKASQEIESPHQQTLCTVNTKDCTIDSESQIAKSIFRTEDTQMYCVETKTPTENKHGLKNNSAIFTEVKTTEGSTMTTLHRQSQHSTTDVPKLVCSRVEKRNESLPSEHSAPSRPKVLTRDFQTQTEVEGETVRAGGDHEGRVCIELRSMATQTEGDSGEMEQASPWPPAGGVEMVHSSTQTEPVEIQDEDPDTSNGELEQNSDSPPLSPALATEGGTSLLFSGSFPIPADPARLAERIRRNRSRMSAAFDDTEYEPYGLPEVVMKGFADIPSGPACPYVLRRGLLGTDALPLPLREPIEEEQDESDH